MGVCSSAEVIRSPPRLQRLLGYFWNCRALDNGHYYAVRTACKHNKCNNGQCKMWSITQVELLLQSARNFYSKSNPTIDAAASYFAKSNTRNRLAQCCTVTRACRPQLFQFLSICVFSARTVAVPDRIPPLRISLRASLSLMRCSALLVHGGAHTSFVDVSDIHACMYIARAY